MLKRKETPEATLSSPPVQVPTQEQLEAQLTAMVVQRSQLKDQVETIEQQMPSIASMIQLLSAQEARAKQEAEVTKD